MKNFRRLGPALVVVACLVSYNSLAAVIAFTHSGTGSGTIGNLAFGASPFTITAVGDTSERIALYDNSVLFGYWTPHATASIRIEGVGTFQFTSPTRTFVNQQNATVGFSRGEPARADLFDGPMAQVFATWNMLTDIGPIIGDGSIMQWTSTWEDVVTSGGILRFATATSPATFQATLVPEPACGALFLCSLALYWVRRSR